MRVLGDLATQRGACFTPNNERLTSANTQTRSSGFIMRAEDVGQEMCRDPFASRVKAVPFQSF